MTLLEKIEKTLSNKYFCTTEENIDQNINQFFVTTYDFLKPVRNYI